jgi:glycosyltransferase involved in cell wall biosynthesis
VTSLNTILSALKMQDIKSDVISTSARFTKDSLRDIDSDSEVKKLIFDLSFPQFWFYSSPMKSWLRKNISHYDLIHLHIPFTAPFFMASRVAIEMKIPMIATLHGMLDPWSMSHKALKKRTYYKLIERQCLSSCAAVHVTSGLEFQAVKNLNIPVAIRNIPWAVESYPEQFIKVAQQHLMRLLFIGRLHPVKSIPTIFNAMAHLKKLGIDVQLDLAGAGDPAYEQLLRQKINQYQIQQQVIWHGHVSEDQKNALYQNADLFVLPSLHENFGLAAAEAMSAGLPVIISDQVGLAPDVLDVGAGFVIPVEDGLSLAAAIKKIHEGNLSLPMGLAAKNLVKNCYSADSFSKNLLDMYQRALVH